MTNSKKKNPAEELIKSVIDELQTSVKGNLPDNDSTALLPENAKSVPLASAIVQKVQKKPPEASQASISVARPGGKHLAAHAGSTEAQLVQAENLKMAQARITELEKELEKVRSENESLASATEVAKEQVEQLNSKMLRLEWQIKEDNDTHEAEVNLYKNSMLEKDQGVLRMQQKVQEMETRLLSDLKKIRVRERELENRLELSKLEKSALVRSKDETILELQRRVDSLSSEVEMYKSRCLDLNQKIENHHEQLGRTVRALRLALTNLEVNENTGSVTIAPLKKAE